MVFHLEGSVLLDVDSNSSGVTRVAFVLADSAGTKYFFDPCSYHWFLYFRQHLRVT